MSTSPSPSSQVHLHEAPTTNKEEQPVSASGSGAPAAEAVRAQDSEDPVASSTAAADSSDNHGSVAGASSADQSSEPVKPAAAAASEGVDKEGASATVTGPESGSSSQAAEATSTADKTKGEGSAAETPSVPQHGPRIPTPSSRTSTPPLHATAAGKKKFSSVSVTKEFLSKAASPAPAAAKLVRPVAAAAPPAAHSKLLSTKLTTVPSSKQSTSPKPPPTTTSSATSSPWAKPAVQLPDGSAQLQHPTPTRGPNVPNVAMGSGQGIGGIGSAARRAWGNLNTGKKSGRDLNRDFPTASEVAEGKRAAMLSAQAVAQAEAAHNQAILQGLNEFTHLEPNTHRWDEEEDDDDPIDFGDGRTFPHDPEDDPVSKQDRFADDFDRSWPRSAASPQRPGRVDSSRVLFNASSNRLEPHGDRQAPHQSQHGPPARIMSRDAPPQHGDRPLPPHLAGESSGGHPNRMLPPHMSSQSARPTHQPVGGQPPRSSWRTVGDREMPPHHQQQPLPPRRGSGLSPSAPRAPLPRVQPPAVPAPDAASPTAPDHAPADEAVPAPAMPAGPVSGEVQAAEMHSAAEKARLRRQQEETEREAAAERARRKAKELAERFGDKSSASSKPATSTPAAAPPGLAAKPAPPPGLGHAPQAPVTIASRSQPGEKPSPSTVGPPGVPLPAVAETHPADRATTWRRVGPVLSPPQQQMDDMRGKNRRRSSDHHQQRPDLPRDPRRAQARDVSLPNQKPTRDVPPHVTDHFSPPTSSVPLKPRTPSQETTEIAAPTPHSSKKEANFDAMLARLQAAMAQTRLSPAAEDEREDVPMLPKDVREVHELLTTHVAPPEKKHVQLAPRPVKYPHLPPEYFDVTQTEWPRSPPPAWRQYTVKIPKPARATLGSIPRWRLKGFDSFPYVPKGWLQTYEPPIPYLPAFSLVSDVLLPQPIGRRFARHMPTGPIVSISPRTLQRFEKRSKRRSTLETRPAESKPAPVVEANQHEASMMATTDNVLKSMKEKEQLFMDKIPSQSGVRFMVSSEHEGDSLLEEVNKMSLEHIGELEDKVAKPDLVQRRPATPPKPVAQPSTSPSKVNPGPWAPGALSYNLASPAARVAPPHEHLKSVWESTADSKPKAGTSTQPQSSVPSQPETPLYPSLTTPSASSESSLKPGGYGQAATSAFGMRSGVSGSFQYPSISSGATSPADGGTGGSGTGMQYGLMGRNNGATGSPAGANGFQQGLWAPSFGSPMTSAGYGFNSANSAQGKSVIADNKSPQMQFATPGTGKEFGNDFRYSNQQGSFQYPQQQFRQQQNMYGHVGYGHSTHTGFGQQMGNRGGSHGGGRFPNHMGQVNGVDYQMAYDPSYYQGQYYGGGVGGVGGLQQQQRGGANGRKLW